MPLQTPNAPTLQRLPEESNQPLDGQVYKCTEARIVPIQPGAREQNRCQNHPEERQKSGSRWSPKNGDRSENVRERGIAKMESVRIANISDTDRQGPPITVMNAKPGKPDACKPSGVQAAATVLASLGLFSAAPAAGLRAWSGWQSVLPSSPPAPLRPRRPCAGRYARLAGHMRVVAGLRPACTAPWPRPRRPSKRDLRSLCSTLPRRLRQHGSWAGGWPRGRRSSLPARRVL